MVIVGKFEIKNFSPLLVPARFRWVLRVKHPPAKGVLDLSTSGRRSHQQAGQQCSILTFFTVTLIQFVPDPQKFAEIVILAERPNSLAERPNSFAERPNSFAERSISFAERPISFAERSISFAERWNSFAERWNSFAERWNSFAEVSGHF